jgi:hypothetical protein
LYILIFIFLDSRREDKRLFRDNISYMLSRIQTSTVTFLHLLWARAS